MALRDAIDAGILDILGPVTSTEEFARRLVAIGIGDRSDAPLRGDRKPSSEAVARAAFGVRLGLAPVYADLDALLLASTSSPPPPSGGITRGGR